MSWEISSKRRTTAASSSWLRCWLSRVKPTMSANPTASTGLCTGREPVAAQHHAALDPAATWRRQTNSSSRAMAGIVTSATLAKASADEHRVDLRVRRRRPGQLGLGDAGHRRADDPGQLHGRLDVGRAERLHPLEELDRLEVEIGEGQLFVGHAGEPKRAPEALELVEATPVSSATSSRV